MVRRSLFTPVWWIFLRIGVILPPRSAFSVLLITQLRTFDSGQLQLETWIDILKITLIKADEQLNNVIRESSLKSSEHIFPVIRIFSLFALHFLPRFSGSIDSAPFTPQARACSRVVALKDTPCTLPLAMLCLRTLDIACRASFYHDSIHPRQAFVAEQKTRQQIRDRISRSFVFSNAIPCCLRYIPPFPNEGEYPV